MEDNNVNETKENKISNNEILIQKYYDSLSEIDKLAFEIAQQQLESSFDVEKTIGFIKWSSDQQWGFIRFINFISFIFLDINP